MPIINNVSQKFSILEYLMSLNNASGEIFLDIYTVVRYLPREVGGCPSPGSI